MNEEMLVSENDRLFEKLARQVPGVLYQYRRFPDGRSCLPLVSSGIRDLYELDPADLASDASRALERTHPDDVARVSASIAHSADTLEPWRCLYRVVLPQKGERWLYADAKPERLPDGSTLWNGYLTDITENQREQLAREESEARYRILVDFAPEAIVVYDMESNRFLDANRNAERLFHLSRADLLTRDIGSVSAPMQPDGRPSSSAAAEYGARVVAGEQVEYEWLYRNAEGEDVLGQVRLVAMPFGGRTVVRGSITDIRERRRIDERLTTLEAAIASSLSAIAVANLSGDLTYVNRAFLELWGFADESEVLGRPAISFWQDPDSAQKVRDALITDGSWSGQLTAQRQDGALRTMTVQASMFFDAAGAPLGLLASFVDITTAKQLQLQLEQSQRLESVGRLAGGVAHDFNNLLTVMKGNLELMALAPGDAALAVESLREIGQAVDSASRLTQQLLAFSRKQIIAPKVLDLNEVVQRTLTMLRRLLGEDIELSFTAGAVLHPVIFDPGQAEQILVNLAVNARDAMPNGGRLTIATSNVYVDERRARQTGMRSGRYVRLTVSDNGIGMSADTQAHAFEPFYTTKEPGHGTGLGLSMIHGAVLQNGGFISVTSEPGCGATFEIDLPAAMAGAVEHEPTARGTLPHGSERVLLVEDDDHLRRMAERLLMRLGYDVTACAGGEEALRVLAESREAFALLLTDVIMPQMNGRVLAEKVLALRPQTKVLFMSGYTADVIAHHGVLMPDEHFLAKPFTLQELALKVREALESAVR